MRGAVDLRASGAFIVSTEFPRPSARRGRTPHVCTRTGRQYPRLQRRARNITYRLRV